MNGDGRGGGTEDVGGEASRLPDPYEVRPLERPPDTTVVLPGSKSLTNRALVAAALATGTSTLTGALDADDTRAMRAGLRALGVPIEVHDAGTRLEVVGVAGHPPVADPEVHVRLSGTTARFLAPVLARVRGRSYLDGQDAFRRRPMGPALVALRELGCTVTELGQPGHLPVTVSGGPIDGGSVAVAGEVSSQFLSGLLLLGPVLPAGLTVRLTTALVSEPYVTLTAEVLTAFGARLERVDERTYHVPGTGYRARRYAIEPDASAASYLLAAAALTGGRVRIDGLGRTSRQGDVAFAEVLGRMGAEVQLGSDHVEVVGTGRLRGIEVDLGAMSDTAQTLAAVAVAADGPTRITGIGFIRAKETDRIAAVVTELTRLGIDAREEPDGLLVHPGTPRPGVVATYDDHRMAMSFALLGLTTPGIRIADPGCVAKTFPGYFDVLEQLRR
ncbi:MAG: 3-phosphoshikimate 1-carboxyvinyltransferase [Nitriliruptoraceae bacterium]